MRISRELLDEVIAHARADAPNECCGMIASRDGEAVAVHRARNAAASPLRYEIDGMEQYEIQNAIEDAGLDLGAIYHSHTRSAPCRRRPTSTSPFYPEALYVIVGLEDERGRRARLVDRRRAGLRGASWRSAPSARLPLLRDGARRRGAVLRALRRAARAGRGGAGDLSPRESERRERARKIRPQYAEGPLVKVVGARNQAEAELLQGMLLEEGVPSLMRRSGGFDVPDFLASGPRDILVPTLGRERRARDPPAPRAGRGAGARRGRGHAAVGARDGGGARGADRRARRRGRLRRGLLGRRGGLRPRRWV